MLKICLIGFRNANLGDEVIYTCTEALVKKALTKLHINEYIIQSANMETEDYSSIESADIILFVGGGIIKYKYQKFYQYIDSITSIAERNQIPVYFHAVGVEGFDNQDEKCIQLKKALNRCCVKQITTRDDITTLNNNYITNLQIKTEAVADAAVCASEVFQVLKTPQAGLIGLGVVREGIFRSNGIDIGLEELLKLWSDIINELESNGYQWELFTTGWPSDMKFANNLLRHLGYTENDKQLVVPQPVKADEVVRTISKYTGVIAGRLHANIISYSLDVPSIGIVWNDKLSRFGESIGFPNRFFDNQHFDAARITEELNNAIKIGYSDSLRKQQQNSTYASICNILQTEILNKHR